MPTHLIKRIDLDKVYPPFLARFLDLLAACQERGAYYFAISGHRSFPEQAKLYFQGRTAPGKIVTNAPAGSSCHNYGIAIDVCRDADLVKVGLQPDWDPSGYDILAEEGAKLGLQVGVPGLVDPGHVQLRLSLLERPEIRTLYRARKDLGDPPSFKETHDQGGLEAVWRRLDGLKLLEPDLPPPPRPKCAHGP